MIKIELNPKIKQPCYVRELQLIRTNTLDRDVIKHEFLHHVFNVFNSNQERIIMYLCSGELDNDIDELINGYSS